MLPQFTIRSLFLCVTIIAVSCALIAQAPLAFAFLFVPCSIAALIYSSRKKSGRRVGIVDLAAMVIVGLVLFALFLPAVHSPRGPTRRNTCINNLHQIGIALAQYHKQYGRYPPAYFADAQGRPLVSWRVLLLPYLDHRILYDQWKQHRDEPWNGPNNSKLSKTVLEFYRCPADTGPDTDTSYVAIVGPDTNWPGTAQVGNHQITDGVARTILLVEVANSGINWMEPRDLDFFNRAPGINSPSGQGVSSNHPAVAVVLMADGRVITINEMLSEQQLRAALTIAGGEKVVLP